MPVYDYDRFGYCVLCSKQLIVKEFIDGIEQMRNTPEHNEVEVLLSDNSKMRICVCKTCTPTVADNLPLIMDKVLKGWEHSIIEDNWSLEKRVAYMDKYSKLSIQGVV